VVFEVLSWEKGHFVYHDKVYPESEDILVDERLDYLILEGLARLDEAKGSPDIQQGLSPDTNESREPAFQNK
jgi:hypothetical protein